MPIGGDLSALFSPGKLGVAGGPPARSEEAGPCRTARPMRVVGRLYAKGHARTPIMGVIIDLKGPYSNPASPRGGV